MYTLLRRQAAVMALQVYGLSLLWQVTKGRFPSLTETYEVTCILISVYIYLTAEKARALFAGGMLAALGCAFRLTALLPIFAIFVFSLRENGHWLIHQSWVGRSRWTAVTKLLENSG